MIAVTQPLRLGDRVVFEGEEGIVEEINLTYTFLRADDDSRIVIPNEKLASDTIRNATIVDRMQRAEITLQVPLSTDLENVIKLLRERVLGRARGRGVRQRPRRQRDDHHARARRRSRRGRARSSTTSACARSAACARPGSSRDAASRARRPPRLRPPPPGPDARPPARAPQRRRDRPGRPVRRPDRPRRRRARRDRRVQEQLLARLAPAGDDRPELVRLRGRRLAARLDPRRAQPPAGAAQRRSARGWRRR